MNRMPNHHGRPSSRPTWQRALAGFLALTVTVAPLRVGIDTTGLAFGFQTAEAGPIVDPYAPVRFQPSIVTSGAGIPVVHVTAPNPTGISHNRFQRFDVAAQGLVLNNSLTGGGTLLGVQVDGNLNFSGRTASLILSEVAVAGPASDLRGPVEVFGDPARVVIANPNGISCNGCAFINTPRVTLTTGIPRLLAAPGGPAAPFETAGALAYDVRSGRVQLGGPVLELSAGRLDVIAETIGIDAPLRAGLAADGRIDLIAGRSLVAETADGGHTVAANGVVDSAASVRAANPDVAPVAEGYAIDATAFGAMSAGTIRVVATTAGLGVRAAAPLAAAAGALAVGANGDLRLDSAYAARDLRLDAAGRASAGATLLAGGDLSLGAGAGLEVVGDVQSGGGIVLHAGGDVQLSGTAIASTDLLVQSASRVEVGNAAAADRLSLLAGTDVRAAGTLLAGSDARIEARNIDTREIAAAGTITLLARESLTASGVLQAGRDVRMEARNVATDEVLAGEALTILAGSGVAAAGRLQAAADVLIGAGNISTAEVLAGGRLTLLSASALTASGRLQAGSDLRLEAQDLATADLLAGGTLSSAATRHALGGTTSALGDASVRATGDMTVAGDLSVGGRLDIAAGSLTNHAVVAAGAATTLSAGTMVNRGTFYGAGIELNAATLDNSRGRLLADGNLDAELGSLAANDGGILAARRDLRLDVSGEFSGQGGTLAAGGNLDLSLPGVSLDAASAGSFESGGRFSLDVLAFANTGTWRPSAASVSVRAATTISNAGDIEVAGDLRATAGTSFVNAGRLFAAGTLDLAAPQLSNQGELLAGGNLAVTAATTNRGAMAAVGNVALSGASLDNAGGRIQSDRNLSIDVAGVLNNAGGTLAALGNADLRAGRILNDRTGPTGTVAVSRGRDAALLDGLVLLADPRATLSDLSPDHASGTVLVAGDPALGTADRLISLPETVRTDSSQAHGAAGRILVLGDAAIRAEGPISNRGGEIVVGGNLALAASALDNGRSADLINGTTVRTDPADLARFVAELNAARGAGLSFQSGTDPTTGDPVYSTVPAFVSNPTAAGTPAVTPGIGGGLQAGGAVALTVGSLIQQGTLTAGGSMTIDSGGALDNTGTIAAAGDLSVRSASLSNAAGARLLAGRDLSLDVTGSLLNRSAVIEAGRDLAIAAGAVGNLDAGPSTTGRTYRVDTPAGYQDDKWLTYAEYAAGVESLVADPAARSKLLAPEYLADYVNYEGSHRIRLAGPTDFYMDSGLTEPTFDFTLTRREGRATITAGRNLDLSAASLTNEASLINAGADLTARVGALANHAGTDEYRLLISAGEWSEYRVYVPAAAALQAGASLSVAAAGSVVNTGNVLGQAIALSGSEFTNGLTDPRIPPITSTQPGAAIPLLPPDLGTPPVPRTGTPLQSLDRAPLALPRVGDTGGASPPPLAGDLAAPRAGGGTRFLHTSPASSALAPLGPDYLLSLLPTELANGRDLLFLADPAVEQQLLREAALRQTGRAWFIDGLAYDDQLQVSADTQQRAALYEAAARFAAATGLGLGVALSPEQLAALDAPMLWYVEQDVPDGAGGTVRALVPVVYLPALDRARLTNVAGGLVQGGDVALDFTGRVTNTGYLAAERTLSVNAREFINARRNADFGKQYQEIEGGWIGITGTRVQPGAFVTAADVQIRASRIESVSGEFEVLGADLAETQAKSAEYLDQLRRDLGAGFVERQAQDDLHFEVHQKRKYDFASIAAMAVGIAVAVLTEGAGTFLLDLQAGSVAAAAADAAVSAMASSAASSLVTGDFAVKDVLRAGLAGGLTAGLSFGIGEQLGNVTLTGGKLVDGNLVRAANAATTLTDKLVGYAVRAGVSAGTQQLVYGDGAGNFGDALLNSFVASAAADAANWVGANTPPQTLQNILAHGAVGCAAAAAMGNDCLAGALGGMTSAVAAPLATQVMFRTAETDGLNNAQRAAIAGTSVLIAGLVAQTLDRNAADAGGAAANEVVNNWLHPKELTAQKRAEAACAAGNGGACQLKLSLQHLDLAREDTDYARTSKGFLTAFVEAGGGMFLAPAQLAAALADGNLVDLAIATLKGVVDLPFEIASGLASDTPEVRGKALAQAVMLGLGMAQLGRLGIRSVAAGPSADGASAQLRSLAGVTDAEAGVPGKYVDDLANRRINPQLESLDNTGGLAARWTFQEGRSIPAEEANQLHGAIRENVSPYKSGTFVVERLAQPGEKLFVIENAMQEFPGSWASPRAYDNLAQARDELALLPEFKDGHLVTREYTVIAPMPVRVGVAGPQISARSVREYPGGGEQIELVFDRGTVDNPTWKQYLKRGSASSIR